MTRTPPLLKISAALVIGALVLLLLSAWPAPVSPSGVVAVPSPDTVATPSADIVAEGRALFRAKGCITCHRHDAVIQISSDSLTGAIWGDYGAPNLTDYQPNPDFLRTWLKDPAALRPNTTMPNLELKEQEIEALIAFLGAP